MAFTLVARDRPYTEPFHCPPPPLGCGVVHLFKTYHLRLDETGAAIVSEQIWLMLQRIPGQPFRLTNEVQAPPAQRVVVPLITLRARALKPGV